MKFKITKILVSATLLLLGGGKPIRPGQIRSEGNSC